MVGMDNIKFTMCHGSANRFVMVDAVAQNIDFAQVTQFVVDICQKTQSDGVLFLVNYPNQNMEMRMFNTDGSQAEMCGNGMRCIARLADEEYLHTPLYTLFSGGQPYPIMRHEELTKGVPTYGVEIAVRQASADFTLSDTEFVAQKIEALDSELTFTYLNLGNPHIVTQVESVDYDLLTKLGERVKEIKDVFPNGVNVSMMQHIGGNEIFVATYERGVGLTASCGTAMTASSTTASILGLCRWNSPISVRNRGGFVKCITHTTTSGIRTELIGNATYEYRAEITPAMEVVNKEIVPCEQQAWEELISK